MKSPARQITSMVLDLRHALSQLNAFPVQQSHKPDIYKSSNSTNVTAYGRFCHKILILLIHKQ